MRIFTIPDIHGRLDLLEKLWVRLIGEEKLDLTKDKVIFLGDYIDRGDNAKGVLRFVRNLLTQHPDRVIALRGNHEKFMSICLLRGRHDDWDLWFYPGNGGTRTMQSFEIDWPCGNPEGNKEIIEYAKWLETLPTSHREHGFFFSHAPVPKEKDRHYPGHPFSEDELIWTYFEDEKGKSRTFGFEEDGTPIVGVCGHIHRLRKGWFWPRHYKNYLFLDAGCGCHSGAPLVCTEVKSRKIIEAWPEGIDHTKITRLRRTYIPKPETTA